MQIDVAKRRQIDHPLRNDASIADYDDCVGLEGGELGAEFVVVLDALGLRDRQIKREGGLFYRRMSKHKTTSPRSVRLRDHQANREARVDQLLQRGHGKARRAAEDESESGIESLTIESVNQ